MHLYWLIVEEIGYKVYIEKEAKLGIKGGKNQGSTPRENAGGMLTMYWEKSTYL